MRGRAIRPPLLASALLRLSLPTGVVRDSILGDFWELHQRRTLSGSAAGARLWYWRHALGLGSRSLMARVRAEQGVGAVKRAVFENLLGSPSRLKFAGRSANALESYDGRVDGARNRILQRARRFDAYR